MGDSPEGTIALGSSLHVKQRLLKCPFFVQGNGDPANSKGG